MINHTLILTGSYDDDQKAEALAVEWALLNMFCIRCRYYARCSSDRNFVFPADTPCMKKKAELLRGTTNG